MTTIAATLQSVKDHGYDDLNDTVIIPHINDEHFEVCTMEPWPFMESSLSPTVNGTVTPTNVLWSPMPATLAYVKTLIDTTNGVTLSPIRYDDIKDVPGMLTQTDSAPSWYYRRGNSFYLMPTCTGNNTYDATVQTVPTALTTGGSVFACPDQLIPTILAGTLSRLAAMEDDPQMAQYWEQLRDRRLARAKDLLLTIQTDRPDRIVDIMEDDIRFY